MLCHAKLQSSLFTGAGAWFSSEAEDGQTPAQFATCAEAGGGGGTAEKLQASMLSAMAQAGSGSNPSSARSSADGRFTSNSAPAAAGSSSAGYLLLESSSEGTQLWSSAMMPLTCWLFR